LSHYVATVFKFSSSVAVFYPILYKGFIALVKQRKIQPPESWNKQTPKEIKVNWTEAEVRDEWMSLKNS